MAGCLVCHLNTIKIGKHYGALTCYPCRAFFRRAQSRKRDLRCKKQGDCKLNGDVKKFCASCRYNKCIQVGMKPALVLKEEEICERFKYQRHSRRRTHFTDNFQLDYFQPGALENIQEPSRSSSFTSQSDHQEDPISSGSGSRTVTGSVAFSQNQLSDFQRVSVIIKNPN